MNLSMGRIELMSIFGRFPWGKLFPRRPSRSMDDDVMDWIRKSGESPDGDDDDSDDELMARFSRPGYSQKISPANYADLMKLQSSHPWVFVCVDRISTTIASIPWRFLTKTAGGQWRQVPGDYPWDDFFEKPNRHQTWDQFMKKVWDYMGYTGNAPLEIVRDEDDKPLEMYPLRPDIFSFTPDAKEYIKNFSYEVEPGRSISLDKGSILWLKHVAALDDYWGISPIQAGTNALILDYYAIAHNRADLTASERAGDAYIFEDGLGKPGKQRFINDLKSKHTGPESMGKKSVILDDGQKLDRAPMTRYDMHYSELRKMSREEILACYSMPPAMVGLFGISGAPGIREQRSIFYENVIMPRLMLFQNAVNGFLLPRDVMFEFDTSEIVALIEDAAAKHADQRADINAGIITINEARTKRGLMPVPWGDKWQASLGIAPIDAPTLLRSALDPFELLLPGGKPRPTHTMPC